MWVFTSSIVAFHFDSIDNIQSLAAVLEVAQDQAKLRSADMFVAAR